MINIERIRYIIRTKDEQKIFCGLAKHYQFKSIDDIGDIAIKTYVSEKKAKSSFLSSWYDSKPEDFDKNGKYKIIKVKESIITDI